MVNNSSEKVLIIIPAYNEADSIERVVESVVQAGYHYVVVNDGSTDDTLRICLANGFNAIDLGCNLGIGGAVQAGHRYALERGYAVDIQFDGDGQHDIDSVPVLIDTLLSTDADLVIGSRFLSSDNMFLSSRARRLGISYLNQCLLRFAKVKVTDATSGFRASGMNAIKLFASEYPSDYPEPSSIALAMRSGLSVKEAPVVMHERSGGRSSIGGLSSIYYMIKVSLGIIIIGLSHRR